jgi:hypothetical protein
MGIGFDKNGRPKHIEAYLIKVRGGQWFGWSDSKNKIYANLRLTEKIGVNGNLVDKPVTELPTESAVNAKFKEFTRRMGCGKRRIDGIHRTRN